MYLAFVFHPFELMIDSKKINYSFVVIKFDVKECFWEENIKKNFPMATILRPSIVYSVDDNFSTNFMTLLTRLPIFPLYYSGKTKFMPIHCSDLTDIISHIILKNKRSKTIECVGPEIISFKDILLNFSQSCF